MAKLQKALQDIIITPLNSTLYKSSFPTRILSRDEKSWIVSMPEHQRRFIPLPVGTIVDIEFVEDAGTSFRSEVIGRSFSGGRTLTLTAPTSISRAGRKSKTAPSRVIAFSSGKGGVGKSTILINVSLALQSLGKKCCIIDADLGTADIDTLLNVEAPFNLYHLVEGEKDIGQIIVEGPQGLLLVPGGSGLEKLANLREWQFSRLISEFNKLEDMADYILIDTGAGVSRNVTNFLMAADDIVLVVTPDPHAIMDAYALLKVLSLHDNKSSVKLIVNMVHKNEETSCICSAISNASRQFLNIPVELLGSIPSSRNLERAVRKQESFFLKYQKHEISASFLKIAERISGTTVEKEEAGLMPFLHRLKRMVAGNFSS